MDEKMLKTKIRRLYDIANVLQSIGLIHKTQMSNSRKPAFKWIGLQGVEAAIQEIKDLVKTAKDELNGHQIGKNHCQLTKAKSYLKLTDNEPEHSMMLRKSASVIECSPPSEGLLSVRK